MCFKFRFVSRALSPLKWQHINPYGTFILNMKKRLPLEPVISATGATLPKFRASLARKTHKKASKAASYLCKVLLRNKLTLQKGRRFDDRL